MAAGKPQQAQDMAVLVFSSFLQMDHRHLGSVNASASTHIAGVTWRIFMSP